MVGMDHHTGRLIERPAHIRQSIEILLTTAKGSRVMRRDIGLNALDPATGKPKQGVTADDIKRDVLEQVATYEPRIVVDDLDVVLADGRLHTVGVTYRDVDGGEAQTVTVDYNTMRAV